MEWKEYSDTSTRNLLAESLRHLMMIKPFSSIRIKDICSEVGVVRVTFYNYFIDKYDALEYLIQMDLILPNRSLIDRCDIRGLVLQIVNTVSENKEFYQKAFEVEGQNGFGDTLTKDFINTFADMLDRQDKAHISRSVIPHRVAAGYYAALLTFTLKEWVNRFPDYSAEQVFSYLDEAMGKGLPDFREQA